MKGVRSSRKDSFARVLIDNTHMVMCTDCINEQYFLLKMIKFKLVLQILESR
jgi:hypothetical protein